MIFKKIPIRGRILALLTLGSLVVGLDRSGLAPAVAGLRDALHVLGPALDIAFGAYGFGFFLALALSGLLIERLGAPRVLLGCGALAAVAMIATAGTLHVVMLAVSRLALGLAVLCAAEREAPIRCVSETAWPDWAAEAAVAEEQQMLLWVTGASVPSVAAAQEMHAGEDGAVLRFATPRDALLAAQALVRQLPPSCRFCLDIEPAPASLPESRLAQVQPALTEAGLFATDAAAAELALLRRPDLRLQPIGRIRSRRRMNRLRLWAVHEASCWA